MEILTSDWLRRMVEKAGDTPDARIVALFEILQDWADAPGMRQLLQQSDAGADASLDAVKQYLLTLCRKAAVSDPDALSSQLLFILLGAVNEEIRQPGSGALRQAGQMASLLLAGQSKPRKSSPAALAFAIPSVAAVIVAALLIPDLRLVPEKQPQRPKLALAAINNPSAEVSPDRIAAIYHLHDEIQAGQCGYPQALMLPPEQRAVYLDNVVSPPGGELAPGAMTLVSQLYQKVDCYYPPAAMLL